MASHEEEDTFVKDVSVEVGDEEIGAASISPSGRDVVLASKTGLYILDLDNPWYPPRHVVHRTDWDVADVQWSPFASRPGRIASTANQKAIIFNLSITSLDNKAPVEYILHAHSRAITDINFSAHHPDILATCAVDSFVLTWDLRSPQLVGGTFGLKPSYSVADFEAGATQVKWNRKNEYIIASSHDKFLRIWDTRKGAVPVTTLAAHQTKIYGIDWHRSDPHKILTCSLDKTIKLWDKVGLNERISLPTRVIHTDHPVRRARHTPFPNGILAMPQRGSSALSLYTYDAGATDMAETVCPPAHTFQAHEEGSHVQEFLWRVRGSFDDGFDNREFQLISWGTDQHLHLYKVPPHLLSDAMGFNKGDPVVGEPTSTRKGAKYVTYRDEPAKHVTKTREASTSLQQQQQQGTLSSLFQSKLRLTTSRLDTMDGGPQRATMTAGSIRHNVHGHVVNSMKWLTGVKVGERRADTLSEKLTDENHRWKVHTNLLTEIVRVGEKYRNVSFEETDYAKRRLQVSFYAPWGEPETANDRKGEGKLVYLRFVINFPEKYPYITEVVDENGETVRQKNPLQVELERTTAKADTATLVKLQVDLNRIANYRASLGREALDGVISYALGDRRLEDSMNLPGEPEPAQENLPPEELAEEESSSDDDDENDGLGIAQDIMNSSLSNANIPLPVQCAVRFSVAGFLILARPPLAELQATAHTGPALRLPRHPAQGLPKDEIFESFGRLNMPRDDGSDSPASSTGSWEWSSSPSSSGSDDTGDPSSSRYQPAMAWQNPSLRFQARTSHPSSVAAERTNKAKSVVSILASPAEQFVPSKKCLAEEYRIFGDGPQVCSHNADVARRFGFEDLADVWELCKLILNNEVPLEILPQQNRRDQVLVLARRALVRIKRKDSGLDLQFDEAETVTNPKLKGRIKWGHHTIVTWLIPALFEHFEKLADTQMLAMLSCVFCEPAAREAATSTMAKMRQSNLPMAMEAPAFSLDYHSSAEAAWSMFKPTLSIPSTPAHSRYATPVNEFGWHRLTKPLDTYGSHGSSNGPWGSDTVPSEPVTPHSTGDTPPNLSRAATQRSTTSHTPYSSSPEQSHIIKKASTGNFASAFATLSRPFANAISSSPPVKSRIESDLSTSAPTGGVTWGTTTFYSSGSNERGSGPSRTKHTKRPSFSQGEHTNTDYFSDSDSEYEAPDGTSEYTAPLTPSGVEEASNIRVTLKNQNQFDEEACVSAPLLDLSKQWLYKAWREQYAELLGCWGLVTKRAEVLKFNGLTSYFPLTNSRGSSKAGSIHLGLQHKDGDGSLPLSRTSTLAPPPMQHFRRSPIPSPRDFSFNPEASEFRPGTLLEEEASAPPPDVLGASEHYLRLSIPTPIDKEDRFEDQLMRDRNMLTDGGGTNKSPGGQLLKPRPSMSRAASKTSSVTGKKANKDPIYSCSICWMKVSGRFFLCPSCGHVAHFQCMDAGDFDEGLGFGWEEGECVVGCGCGCGFEQEEQGEGGMKSGWEERGGWLPEDHEKAAYEPSGYESGHAEEMDRFKADTSSPEKGKGKAKGKRRAVSALSYY
ncbi:hypothetical protein K491DRAFT_692819 [Lophiostoma macrostomum CBS 122681]|uniref:WDR59/RTC1-like RING zinc finger domain-containing protein n=1 Tax=Lophiostoma macrostomum CBS 122681 TaxID=1314788 RepID=A0A6A6T6L0_9PLEO|nr:hypothetical protein K491DRAFT_692819 [Lophiostoma macrostomum CBS 122681]